MTHNSLKRQMLNSLARDILVETARQESRKGFAEVVLALEGERAGE